MFVWGQDLQRLVLFYLGLSKRNWLAGENIAVLNTLHCPDAEQVSRAVGLLVGLLVSGDGCNGTVKCFGPHMWSKSISETQMCTVHRLSILGSMDRHVEAF